MICSNCGIQLKVPVKREPRNPKRLSRREIEVVACVVRGLSSKQIGETLFIAEKTVKFHLTNIYKKTQAKSRAALVAGWYMKTLESEVIAQLASLSLPETETVLASGAR